MKRSFLYDSWSSNGTLSIRVFSSYSIEAPLMVKFFATQKSIVHRKLSSVVKMAFVNDGHNDQHDVDCSHETID